MANYADLVLVQCPVWAVNMPPMTLALISRYLREHNIKVKVFDLNINEYNKSTDKEYWINEKAHFWMEKEKYDELIKTIKTDFSKIADDILKENPKAVGFSISAANRFYAIDLMKKIRKKSNIPIIAGGKGVWLEEERKEFLDLVDFFAMGEGEETILELIKGIKAKKSSSDLSKIQGLKTKIGNFRARPLGDFYNIIFPDYKEFDLSLYTERTIGIIFSKGCIGRCNFCEDKPFQGNYRTRDPIKVFEEIKYHVEINKVNNFWFHDLAINGDYKTLEKLCDLIIKSKLKIKWIALAIARKDMPRSLLFKMKEAGCFTLNFGIESGSDSMLKKMDKYELFSSKDAERVLKDTWEAGINTQLNFIVGYPTETEEEFLETYEFLKRNKKYICGITNINTCIIPKIAPIGIKPEKYNIEKSSAINAYEWASHDNNLELRMNRAKRLYSLARELGYDIWFSNLSQSKKKEYDSIILLCPPWGIYTPPIGINHLKNYLISKGLNVAIKDINIELFNWKKELQEYWGKKYLYWPDNALFQNLIEKFKEKIDKILAEIADKTDIFGFSAYQDNINFILYLSKKIKEINPKAKVVIGGPSTKVERELKRFEKNVIDFAVIGDGEESFFELISAIKKNSGYDNISDIPGVLVIGEESKYKKRTPLDLSNTVFGYNEPTKYLNKNGASIYLNKGCPGKCTFCNDKNLMGEFRTRPAKEVFEEIKQSYLRGINEFTFTDLLINGNLKELDELCLLITKSGLKIKWIANAIAMQNLTMERLKNMKKAGCNILMYGIESGSQKIIKDMKKFFSVKSSEIVLKNAKNAGIKNWVNLIVGYPTETNEDFLLTIKYLERNRHLIDTICNANTCNIVYNSELMDNLEKYNIILPKDERFSEVFWKTKDNKNNIFIRKKRLKTLLLKCRQLKIKVLYTNAYAFDEYLPLHFKELKEEEQKNNNPNLLENNANNNKHKNDYEIKKEAIDLIEFGIDKSEKNHKLFGNWSKIRCIEKNNWRGFFGVGGFSLKTKEKEYFKTFKDLKIQLSLKNMEFCSAKIYFSYDYLNWFKIGEIEFNGNSSWEKHLFKINSQIIRSHDLFFKIELSEKNRFGKIKEVLLLNDN